MANYGGDNFRIMTLKPENLTMNGILLPKVGICEVYFGYNTKMEVYANPSSHILKLCAINSEPLINKYILLQLLYSIMGRKKSINLGDNT